MEECAGEESIGCLVCGLEVTEEGERFGEYAWYPGLFVWTARSGRASICEDKEVGRWQNVSELDPPASLRAEHEIRVFRSTSDRAVPCDSGGGTRECAIQRVYSGQMQA